MYTQNFFHWISPIEWKAWYLSCFFASKLKILLKFYEAKLKEAALWQAKDRSSSVSWVIAIYKFYGAINRSRSLNDTLTHNFHLTTWMQPNDAKLISIQAANKLLSNGQIYCGLKIWPCFKCFILLILLWGSTRLCIYFTNSSANTFTQREGCKHFIMLALLAVHNSGGIKKFQNYLISVSAVKNDIDWL